MGAFGNDVVGANHRRFQFQHAKHERAGPLFGADDFQNRQLPVTPKMPAAIAAIDQHQFPFQATAV